jgi:hypothetical protein
MPGTLYLYADRVRIVAGPYEAVHPRKFVPQEGSAWLRIVSPWWQRFPGREANAMQLRALIIRGLPRLSVHNLNRAAVGSSNWLPGGAVVVDLNGRSGEG